MAHDVTLRPLADQIDRVLAGARLRGSAAITLPVGEAEGHVLVADAVAAWDMPVFDNSAMDGYAVKFDDIGDTPTVLRVVADVPAGSGLDPKLGPGECARIMTGAACPSDADTVVPLEDTEQGTDITDECPDTITVVSAPSMRGRHIRRAGEDVSAGTVVATTGTRLTGRWISGLMACGVVDVVVGRRPRVAVITTGSELVPQGTTELSRGEIIDSNGALIEGCARAHGAEVTHAIHVSDNAEEFMRVLNKIQDDVDVIITTGGVSVGAFDIVRLKLDASAWDVEFTKVAMQPGKPQGFGVAPSGALFFGLPGNPVSAFVSFEVFVALALDVIAGGDGETITYQRAMVGHGWKSPAGKMQFMPVRFTDASHECVVPSSVGGSGSHLVARLGAAEALALIPPDTTDIAVGDTVTVRPIKN